MFLKHCSCRLSSGFRTKLFSTAWQPTDFGASFQLPPRSGIFVLEKINSHPLDKLVSFDEQRHKYSFEGTQLRRSVTDVISSYFKKFDADTAIKGMMEGGNWPRPQYCDDNGVPFSPDVIKKKWNDNGELARNQGTWMHANIENFLNNRDIAEAIPEFGQFLCFIDEVIKPRGIQPYRTEWRIAAPDLSLGGSVDFVGAKPDGTYVLMDWKRSKNLPTEINAAYGKLGKGPMSHLPDCAGSKYSLQLNMYRYILKKYYDVHVSEMVLAAFHPDLEGYFATPVPEMDAEISAIVQDIAANSACAPSTSKEKTLYINGS